MAESQGEKTEKPTPKKVKDAREKGRLARSRDLAVAGATVAATMSLAAYGDRLIVGLGQRMASDLSHFGDAAVRTIEPADLTHIVLQDGALLVTLVGPIALATMIAGVGVHGFQGGWSFAPGALQLNWSRLNPANNVKRFGILHQGADSIKSFVSAMVIAWFGWRVISPLIFDGTRLAWGSPVGAALWFGLFTWSPPCPPDKGVNRRRRNCVPRLANVLLCRGALTSRQSGRGAPLSSCNPVAARASGLPRSCARCWRCAACAAQ